VAIEYSTYHNGGMPRTKAETLRALGKKIKKLRKIMAVSQEELAHQLKISRVYMGFIEQGRESPSLKLLLRMSRKFGVKMEELFGR
jgi:DNA-binding XRE family transcriptional regulator